MKQKESKIDEIVHTDQPTLHTVAPGEVIIGTLVEIDRQGQALVDYHHNPIKTPVNAMSTLSVGQKHVGRQVALLFADGRPEKPVIMGFIHSPLQEMLETYEVTPLPENTSEAKKQHDSELNEVTIDGKRLVLEGREEIMLRCGDASITLTRAGKILIRGKYLLNRSEGVNRVMGGSVQIN